MSITNTKRQNIFFRICFLSLVFVFAQLCQTLSAHAAPKEYTSAKVELNELLQNENKAKFRHNWLKISDAFYEIYRNNATWNNRPAALFRSARALDEMSKRSYVKKDAQLAASRYEMLAKKFPTNPLADDSLFLAAILYNEQLQQQDIAKKLLSNIRTSYKKEDHYPKALEYLAEINGNKVASLAPLPLKSSKEPQNNFNALTTTWQNGVVRIVLNMDNIAKWRAKFHLIGDHHEPCVVITLNDTKPASNLSLEESLDRAGIFTSYSVDYDPINTQSSIILRFSDIKRYQVKSERSPAKLIIEATISGGKLANGIQVSTKPNTQNSSQKDKPQSLPSKGNEKKKNNEQKAVSPKEIQEALNLKVEPRKKEKDKRYSTLAAMTKEARPQINKYLEANLNTPIKTIVIDPGHGGKDAGAIHNGIYEKNINLQMSKKIASVLRQAGYKVYLTRTDDRYIELYERTDIARKYKADLFISIHANASTKSHVWGFETYFLDFGQSEHDIRIAAIENSTLSQKNLGDLKDILGEALLKNRIQESKKLASFVQKNTLHKITNQGYNAHSGGTRGAPFHVLIGSSTPAILIEMGYSSNKTEAKRLKSYKYQNAMAEGIANGIHHYAASILNASK